MNSSHAFSSVPVENNTPDTPAAIETAHPAPAAPPLAPAAESKTARRFTQYLREQLSSGNLAPGVRLPAERLLAEQFGISRGTVRRALKQLEAEGRIVGIRGSGTFVQPVSTGLSPPPSIPKLASPAELIEARICIEPVMPELIVCNAHSDDFDAMEQCLRRAEQARTMAEFEKLDHELHRLFAVATHNSLFIHIMDLIGKARTDGGWAVLKERSYTPERHRHYMQQHSAIVQALKNRDLHESRRLITEHLVQIRKNLFGN
ncbi:GntR family transcriptional regulator [Bordetella petrii]|nr:GntR family transcriptional regulator [Bordetella petrii]